MAYLNGNVTCFTPQLTLEQSAANLQEKAVDDISNGDIIVQPDNGYQGLSKVNVSGLYFNESGEPYAKVMRIKKANGTRYENSEKLEKVIVENCAAGAYTLGSFAGCRALEELIFDNNCNGDFLEFSIDVPLKRVRFLSVSDSWQMDGYNTLVYQNYLERIEVYNGWDKSLPLYPCSLISLEDIKAAIENFATVTDGQTLELPAEIIDNLGEHLDLALSKGWDVY